jgi:hypothetical protein
MAWTEDVPPFRASIADGWEAAMLEIEHQAEHWETPDHRETGQLIAAALRAAVDIARSGGLRCEHRQADQAAVGLDASSAAPEDPPRQKSAGHRRRRHAA